VVINYNALQNGVKCDVIYEYSLTRMPHTSTHSSMLTQVLPGASTSLTPIKETKFRLSDIDRFWKLCFCKLELKEEKMTLEIPNWPFGCTQELFYTYQTTRGSPISTPILLCIRNGNELLSLNLCTFWTMGLYSP